MDHISRRRFLTLGVGAALTAGLVGASACEDDETPRPATTGAPPPATTEAPPKTQVAAIRGSNLQTMTRDALDAVGGIGNIVHDGESVFIKPNFVTIGWAGAGRNPFLLGECTKPEILATVAEECLKVGAREVIIGDASQVSAYSWEYATWLDGSTNLFAEARRLDSAYDGTVTLACLDADSPDWPELPSRTGMGKVAVSGLVARADRIISIPVLKTHQWATLTLALKNFVGVTPLVAYGATTNGTTPRLQLHIQGIEQVFLDVVAGLKPDLAVIDCSLCLEADGPSAAAGRGLTVDMKERLGSWLLLAGTDLAAVDATAARIISHDVEAVRFLTMAQEQGLGETRLEAIDLIGERLDDLRVDWLPAQPAQPGQLSRGHLPPESRPHLL